MVGFPILARHGPHVMLHADAHVHVVHAVHVWTAARRTRLTPVDVGSSDTRHPFSPSAGRRAAEPWLPALRWPAGTRHAKGQMGTAEAGPEASTRLVTPGGGGSG